MQETSFFEGDNVRVTNARFIVGGQTYAMNGVTSVKTHREDPSVKGPLTCVIIGVLMLIGGDMPIKVAGVALAAFGAWWWTQLKPTLTVVLNSASGEAQALSSQDASYIESVVAALNNAVVHRG